MGVLAGFLWEGTKTQRQKKAWRAEPQVFEAEMKPEKEQKESHVGPCFEFKEWFGGVHFSLYCSFQYIQS